MSIKNIMTRRFCISLGAALAFASVLVTQRGSSDTGLDGAGAGIIYVYFPSLCAAPRDASDCHEIVRPERPAFVSMAECSAYADVELQHENNPRVLASCMKERES